MINKYVVFPYPDTSDYRHLVGIQAIKKETSYLSTLPIQDYRERLTGQECKHKQNGCIRLFIRIYKQTDSTMQPLSSDTVIVSEFTRNLKYLLRLNVQEKVWFTLLTRLS